MRESPDQTTHTESLLEKRARLERNKKIRYINKGQLLYFIKPLKLRDLTLQFLDSYINNPEHLDSVEGKRVANTGVWFSLGLESVKVTLEEYVFLSMMEEQPEKKMLEQSTVPLKEFASRGKPHKCQKLVFNNSLSRLKTLKKKKKEASLNSDEQKEMLDLKSMRFLIFYYDSKHVFDLDFILESRSGWTLVASISEFLPSILEQKYAELKIATKKEDIERLNTEIGDLNELSENIGAVIDDYITMAGSITKTNTLVRLFYPVYLKLQSMYNSSKSDNSIMLLFEYDKSKVRKEIINGNFFGVMLGFFNRQEEDTFGNYNFILEEFRKCIEMLIELTDHVPNKSTKTFLKFFDISKGSKLSAKISQLRSVIFGVLKSNMTNNL